MIQNTLRIPAGIRMLFNRSHPESRKRKRTIANFAEKNGFVYFGHVDQHTDEHDGIRGYTTSTYHQDDNFVVGTYDEYDVKLVDRTDAVSDSYRGNVTKRHIIVAITLKSDDASELPYMMLVKKQTSHEPYPTFHSIQPVPIATVGTYDHEFTSRYELLASAEHFIEVEHIISPSIAMTIGAHFWPFNVEISRGVVYVYSDEKNVSDHTLTTMVRTASWLAQYLDSK